MLKITLDSKMTKIIDVEVIDGNSVTVTQVAAAIADEIYSIIQEDSKHDC